MQEIINTEWLNITFDQSKHRLYYTEKELWKGDPEQEEQIRNIIQRLHRLIPQQITVLIDVSRLKLTPPQITESLAQHTIQLLHDQNVNAVAQVIAIENAFARTQFEKNLKTLGKVGDRINIFTNRHEAEIWLDSINV